MFRERSVELLPDCREAPARIEARPAAYPAQPRWPAVGERAPGPADADPSRRDLATACA